MMFVKIYSVLVDTAHSGTVICNFLQPTFCFHYYTSQFNMQKISSC